MPYASPSRAVNAPKGSTPSLPSSYPSPYPSLPLSTPPHPSLPLPAPPDPSLPSLSLPTPSYWVDKQLVPQRYPRSSVRMINTHPFLSITKTNYDPLDTLDPPIAKAYYLGDIPNISNGSHVAPWKKCSTQTLRTYTHVALARDKTQHENDIFRLPKVIKTFAVCYNL